MEPVRTAYQFSFYDAPSDGTVVVGGRFRTAIVISSDLEMAAAMFYAKHVNVKLHMVEEFDGEVIQ
jgi:hypothetical protein